MSTPLPSDSPTSPPALARSTTVQRSYGIQYLRAVAAVAVVIFHAVDRFGGGFEVGAAGVDVFFVLSGFLMWTITDENTRPGAFLGNRVRRIVPVYWIATTVVLVGAFAGVFVKATEVSTAHTLASYAFIPWTSPSTGQLWPLLVPGWTLNYEMFFYVSFAALLVIPRRAQLLTLSALFALLTSIGLAAAPSAGFARFYTNPIILEFLAGAWLGALWSRGATLSAPTSLLLIAAGIAGFAATAVVGLYADRVLAYGVPAVALLAGTIGLERAQKLPRWHFWAFLGDSSYAIYLWHTLAFGVVSRVCKSAGVPDTVAGVLAVLGGLGVGIAGYWLIERPIATRLKPRRKSRGHVPLSSPVQGQAR